MGYSKKEKEKRMAFLLPLPVAAEIGWVLLAGVGAAIVAGSMLRNTNNRGPILIRNTNSGRFDDDDTPIIHKNKPTTPPVTHQPTAPQVPVHRTLPPVTIPETTQQPVLIQHKVISFAL